MILGDQISGKIDGKNKTDVPHPGERGTARYGFIIVIIVITVLFFEEKQFNKCKCASYGVILNVKMLLKVSLR